MVFIIGGSIVF